jgi:Mce-associated membrane protein
LAIHADPAGELSTSDTDTSDIPEEEASVEDEVLDYEESDDEESDDEDADDMVGDEAGRWSPHLKWGLVAGLVAVLAVGGLSGWLGVRAHHAQQVKQQDELYLQVAKQGAVNLTTIDYQDADTDVQRILDSATGTFYDDFAQRSAPFIDVVKKTQSKTEGTVTEAGLESVTGDQAQAIVAVNVITSNNAAGQQQPRVWRMRLTMEKMGPDVKVSNVGFIQ